MAQEKALEILKERSVIQIRGADSAGFLQGLVTNNINLPVCYSCVLNSKGKYLFDFFIINQGAGRFLIDIEEGRAHDFMKKLNFLKLASDVHIKDLSDNLQVAYGRQAAPGSVASFQDMRYSKMGVRSIVQAGSIKTSFDKLYLEDKYQFALPCGADMITEKSIILEYGIHHLSGVDFNKGCYTGQELISRTHNLGVVRKKIFKITLDSPAKLAQGDRVVAGEQEIGQITSSYQNMAMALLNEEKLKNSQSAACYAISSEGVKAEITITSPPWRAASK